MNDEIFDAASHYIGTNLDDIFVVSSRRTFEESLAALQSLEDDFLRSSDAFALEVKRRIAERRLAVAMQKNRSLGQCAELFDEVKNLGFTDLGQECLVTNIYCRYLLRGNAKQDASRLLKELQRKCSAIDVAGDAEITDLMRFIDQLANECS
jgi:hypothetical protein